MTALGPILAVLLSATNASKYGLDPSQSILLLLTSSGFTAVLVSVLGSFANKKRVSAEATNLISQAAGGVVDRLEKENTRVCIENEALRARNADLILAESKKANEVMVITSELERCTAYRLYLVATLHEAGTDFSPPEDHLS